MIVYTDGHGEVEFTNKTWSVNNDRLVFMLRGCNDAMLALNYIPGDVSMLSYIIYIGIDGNSKTRLVKKGFEDLFNHTYDSPDIINCWEDRAFWVHWGGSYIEFGKGTTPGSEPVGTLYDPDLLQIHGLSLASQNSVRCRWQLPKFSGQSLL